MDNIFSKSFKNLFLLFAVFMLVFGVVSAADVIINIENQYDVYPISGSLPDDYILNTKPSVIEDVTPIEVSLSGTYAGNVRIEATNPFETDIQLWAEDTEGNWYDISKTGWGPSLGFPITSDVTEVYPAGIEGTYTVTIDVKAINGTEAGNTIATKSEDISFGIQSAVDNAGAEDIIYISAGTYEEDLLIDATKTGLTLIGESKEDVILDVSDVDGVSGCSPLSGICILADDITLKDFTIAGDNETIVERAIKLREVDNVELTNLLIKNIKKDKGSWFTGVGIDAFISSNINFNNLEIIDNGGAGIYMKNPQGASISDITTNNNSWGGIAIGNDCAYSTCSTTGVVISGTNSFGESLDESPNGGIYLEAENGGVMPNFGYSSSEVQIQQNDFEYILSGEPSGDLPQVLFFKSKEKAIDSALSNLHVHLAEDGRYVKEIGGKNYYVEEGMSIQDAIDDATAGDVINVGAGEYDETLNIEDKNDIKIIGENKDTTILKPTTKLDWNIGSYTNNRQTLIRVIDSTNIDFQLLTLDMENIKSNFLFGVLYWDSTGELSNNAFKNNQLSDLSGGYYELGLGLRAPGYSDESRAYINVSNNIFGNTGRVAINTHDYVAMDIIGNTFYKTENDFGYAIELGSRSIGNIKDNLIYGYNTKAESDNSESAGIYIENAFTNDQITSLEKNIVIENNEIYNSQFGIWIGNGYDKFAGNVNIIGTVKNNYVHDSFCSNCGSEDIFGGILIQDEDKEYGSSVNLTFSNNTIQNNEYGYYIFTQGDGNLDLDFEEETIENNKFGFYVTETEDGSSLYNINIKHSSIINNEHYALYNDLTEIINAIDNWWGSNDPYFENLISGDVTYSPWITKAESIVETESGVEKEVNTTGTNSSINLTTSTSTSGTITVQQYGNDPKGGFSLNSNALGKFINIESTISNEDISEVEIRIYYTDSEILASGLDETTLKMHYYNETTSAWEIVNSSGVNVTGNYVWAITDHFSDYGVGGENDTSGPFINLSHLSKPYPNPNDEDFTIYVWANITDPSGVKDYPTLQWKAKTREGTIVYDNGETSMQPFGDLYYGGITAPKIDGLEILYKITAYDNLDIDSYYPNCQITGTLFYYDGLAPVTSLIIGFEDTPIYETDLIYVNSSTKFNLTCDDGANGNGCNKTSYKINGSSWINFISEFLIDNSNNDGVYNISYYSIDNSNNDEDVKSQLVTLDNTAPVTTDDSSSNWTNQDVIVKLNPTDSGSGVGTTYYCVGDENCEPNLNNTLNILVDCLDDDVCQKYVRYYSVDNLGNAESVKTSQQINIDKIAPVTEDSRTDDLWYNENVTVTLTPSLETGESGINATYYCIDSDGTCNPRTDGEQGTIINIGTEGINYLRYQSEDLAGNLEAVQSTDYPVQIDKETPTLYYHSRTNPTDTDMKADDTDLPETLGYGYYDHIGDGFNWTGDKLLQKYKY
ncbi:right-handed parallel beta-helix repeat-containing protein [Candidatus Pacearchaeota archaeon]|nr:right-handed parallel beta-helix repeat-containing protein [Candidatus Pacearchaeota archaeon]